MGRAGVGLLLLCLFWVIQSSLSKGFVCGKDAIDGCKVNGCDHFGNCLFCAKPYYAYGDKNNPFKCKRCSSGCKDGGCETYTGRCKSCRKGLYGPTCSKTCISKNCKRCNRKTGQCISCKKHYNGSDCSSTTCAHCVVGCKKGWFGHTCSRRCTSNCKNNQCDRDTGRCTECRKKFEGDDCSISTNHLGSVNYNRKCVNHQCDRKNGTCKSCKSGYYKHPDTKCKLCSSTCLNKTCDRDNGTCLVCKKGFYSYHNTCQKCGNCASGLCYPSGKCNGCQRGYYGEKCKKHCSAKTYGCNLCTQDGKCTTCYENYKPPECKECADGYFKSYDYYRTESCSLCQGTCYNNAACNKTNGFCDECPYGKTGHYCEQGCKSGTYGPNCIEQCGQCLHGEPCDKETGLCTAGCQPGFTPSDRLCKTSCKYKTFGLNCTEQCGQCLHREPCDTVTGLCTAGCQPGFTPSDHLCRTSCKYKTFGLNCTEQCGQCLHSEPCDTVTGLCTAGCQPGFTPSDRLCKTSCKYKTFGLNCTEQCGQCLHREPCDTVTGLCTAGCQPGFTPSDHLCRTSCKYKTFGLNCTEQCGQCLHSEPCDTVTGLCTAGCQPGFTPSDRLCKTSCKYKTFGLNCTEQCGQCLHREPCDTVTGLCTAGCQPGFTPSDHLCRTSCKYKTFGLNCTEQCGQCLHSEPCDTVTGLCTAGCQPGFTPSDRLCKTSCKYKTFGLNCTEQCGQCLHREPCDTVTGLCTAGCQPGFTPSDHLCRTSCKSKTFGLNCTEQCGQCLHREPCDTETGLCTAGCQPGFTPSDHLCKTTCKTGWYGEDCNKMCGQCKGATCHHVTGDCQEGCAEGFFGSQCFQSSQTEEGTLATVIGTVVGVISLVAIVAVGAAVVFITTRKQRKKAKQRSASVKMTKTGRQLESSNVSNVRLSFTPSALQVSGNTIPQATVKPTKQKTNLSAKPAIKPKSTSPASGTVYENIVPQGLAANTVTQGAAQFTLETDNAQKTTAAVNKKKTSVQPAKFATEEGTLEAETKGLAEPLVAGDRSRNFQLHLLHQLMVERLNSGGLEEEFACLELNKGFSVTNGQRQANYKKNRFNNILPFDKTRVQLDKVDGDDASDYINASFIQGYNTEKAYIAAQGPKNNTYDDFWRMVWQEGVSDIVMLTRLNEGSKNKCFEYWPEAAGSTLNTKHMKITMVEEEARGHFVIRTLRIQPTKCKENPRCVMQYHYMNWLDHAVPTVTPFINFWRYVREQAPRTPSAPPLVVHCSAGVGRTGTYIALDVIFDQAQKEAEVNICNTVDKLRDDRCSMVQTKSQYKFLHEAVLEAYTSRETRIKVSSMDVLLSPNIQHTEPNDRIDEEFETLCKMRAFKTPATYIVANLKENCAKNRNPLSLPDDQHLVFLTKHVVGRNQYINAVYMATFLQQHGSIITQLPLPDTMVDLWRLVDGCGVNTIVSIGDVEAGEQDCYWPKVTGSSLNADPYVIKLDSTARIGDTLWSYQLILEKDDTSQDVCVLHLDSWTGQVPDNTADLIHLLTTLSLSHKRREDKPVIIQCNDGSSKSGVICVLWDVLSRMTCDSELDVYLAVRQLYAEKPDVCLTLEQYRYCYKVAQQFQDAYSIYSNT